MRIFVITTTIFLCSCIGPMTLPLTEDYLDTIDKINQSQENGQHSIDANFSGSTQPTMEEKSSDQPVESNVNEENIEKDPENEIYIVEEEETGEMEEAEELLDNWNEDWDDFEKMHEAEDIEDWDLEDWESNPEE